MSLSVTRRLKPRKTPSQRRGVETRDVILEAAAQVLEAHGYDKTTTNRVAERAGVSIGTIYEYYPNKDALLSDLQAKYGKQTYNTFIQVLTDTDGNGSLRKDLQLLIKARIAATTMNTKLHAKLQNDLPFVDNRAEQSQRLKDLRKANIKSMESRRSEFRVDDVAMLSDLLMYGLHGYFDHLAQTDPDQLNDASLVERLTDAVFKMVSVNAD